MPARPLRSSGLAELVKSVVCRLFFTKDLKQFQCDIEFKVRPGYSGHDPSEHGGPNPATSDGRATSVGTLAIERFLRPVCYQDFPPAIRPQGVEG